MRLITCLFSMIFMFTNVHATGVASVVTPYTPDESVPTGLEDVPINMTKIVNQIEQLPVHVQATGGGSLMVIPELAELKAGLEMYKTHRKTCIADQAGAANFCREETSPDLQKTLAGVNLVLAGANSLAVNDACKSFSKALSVAQLGITAYTAACGIYRKKCNLSCSAAANGMKKVLNGLVADKATCTEGTNLTTCTEAMTTLQTLKKSLLKEVEREASLSDKKSLHSKEKLCQHTYGLLLVSAGASLLSVAKSFGESKKCEEDSAGGEGSPATPAAAESTPTASTPTKPSPEPVTPETPTPEAATPSQTEPDTVATAEVAVDPRSNDPSGLRDYLPGGSKSVAAASSERPHPDITGPAGKSNFQKMSIRYKELRLNADEISP